MTALSTPAATPPSVRPPFPSCVGFVGLAACALLNAPRCAEADPVPQPAAPPVGFVQVTVPSNGYALVSMPFEPFDPGINAILGGQLTGSTSTNTADALMRWLPALQAYTNAWRAAGFDPALDGLWIDGFDGAPAPSLLAVSAGDAFWLRSCQPFEQRAFVAGRVPLASSSSATLVPGYNLSGYAYASSTALSATSLLSCGGWAPESGYGDELTRWPESGDTYLWYGLRGEGAHGAAGWYADGGTAPTTDRLRLGEGFWYSRGVATNSFVWTEPRPYAAAFGDANVLPCVIGLCVDPAVPSATLTIQAQSGTDWPVDILTLDADTNGTFAVTGWSHAARVQSLGQASFAWTDLPGYGRPAVTNVHARFYLAARADLDADSDGLPDALETHVFATEPAITDSDEDELSDGWEVDNGTDPLDADTDGDELSDGVEVGAVGTSPLLADTDGDGLLDGDEIVVFSTYPLDADTDDDGLIDGQEVHWRGAVRWDIYCGRARLPSGLTNLLALAAGDYHSLALNSDGTVTGWGEDLGGQATVPLGLADVVAIAAGDYHSLALRSDGTVVAWGADWSGQATVPPGLADAMAIAAGAEHNLALRSDGTVVAWGADWSGQATVPPGLADVAAISAGDYHSLALRSDGTVVAWGADWNGQATVPPGLADVVAISAGDYHSLALRSDGTVVAWGADWSGQATVPPGLADVVAIAAGTEHNIALMSDGTVAAWGTDFGSEFQTVSTVLSSVTHIAAHGNCSLAVASLDPLQRDTDADGVSDGSEVAFSLDPLNPDTDGDGLPDGWERAECLDPLDRSDVFSDYDCDGLPAFVEFLQGLSPTNAQDGASARRIYVDACATGIVPDGSSDNPYPTVRQGIDAALPGDVVKLAPGRYVGSGNFGLSVMKSLFIDGDQSSTLCVFDLGRDDHSAFEIGHGCTVSIRRVMITGAYACSPVLSAQWAQVHLQSVAFVDNWSQGSCFLHFAYMRELLLENVVAAGNDWGETMIATTMKRESATDEGAIRLRHCTVVGNASGITLESHARPAVVQNSIVYGNDSFSIASWSLPASVIWSCVEDACSGEGNFDADPLLQVTGVPLPGSPCIDAAGPSAPVRDLLGNLRHDVASVTNLNGSAADIGALEYNPTPSFADANANGLPDDWELESFGTNWMQFARQSWSDSDGDGTPDGLEWLMGSDPAGRLDVETSWTGEQKLDWSSGMGAASYRVTVDFLDEWGWPVNSSNYVASARFLSFPVASPSSSIPLRATVTGLDAASNSVWRRSAEWSTVVADTKVTAWLLHRGVPSFSAPAGQAGIFTSVTIPTNACQNGWDVLFVSGTSDRHKPWSLQGLGLSMHGTPVAPPQPEDPGAVRLPLFAIPAGTAFPAVLERPSNAGGTGVAVDGPLYLLRWRPPAAFTLDGVPYATAE